MISITVYSVILILNVATIFITKKSLRWLNLAVIIIMAVMYFFIHWDNLP